MRYFIFIITVTLLFSCTSQQKECILKGEIIDHECDTLLLFKASKFPIYETKIPVINSKFLYAFPFTQSEVYAKSGQADHLIPEQIEHMIPEMAEHLKPELKHHNINAKQ